MNVNTSERFNLSGNIYDSVMKNQSATSDYESHEDSSASANETQKSKKDPSLNATMKACDDHAEYAKYIDDMRTKAVSKGLAWASNKSREHGKWLRALRNVSKIFSKNEQFF